jgi:hypothetical protein
LQQTSELAAAKKELAEQEESICRMQKVQEMERQQLEERLADLERAKEVLLDAKVDLQRQLEDSGKEKVSI